MPDALLSPDYVPMIVTTDDLVIASLAWGFTLGFGWLTCSAAMRQTMQVWKKHGRQTWRNAYVWMIWAEIFVCLAFSIICFLHLKGYIPPSFVFYFSILTLWALQVQFLLQIIINRCAVLIPDRRFVKRIKIGTAVIITMINISVYCIWIPARLQISHEYIWINEWWDRCEKCFYLLIDAALNIYFISVVQRNLVTRGITKYKSLVKFNLFIIAFSLSMDVLIIAMMSLPNTFVYMQFHPFAYTVKLKIEMSMADLIVIVAQGRDMGAHGGEMMDHNERNKHNSTVGSSSGSKNRSNVIRSDIKRPTRTDFESLGSDTDIGLADLNRHEVWAKSEDEGKDEHVSGAIFTTREVHVEFETSSQNSQGSGPESSKQSGMTDGAEDDTRPLKPNNGGTVHIWNNGNPRVPTGV